MKTPRTNEQFVQAFALQQKTNGRLNSLLIDGDTIYSFGYHYPLAMHITNDAVLINDEGYSRTTAKHIGLAMWNTNHKKQLFVSEVCIGHVLAHMEYLRGKLAKARKPQLYTTQIQRLYHLFHEGMAYMGGFYIKHKGYFTGTEFSLVKYNDRTPEQAEQLDKIQYIYNVSKLY